MSFGSAIKAFCEQYPGAYAVEEGPWPMLEAMLGDQVLEYIDYAVAELWLGKEGCEDAAAFLCLLSRAAREGHLCVKVAGKRLLPFLHGELNAMAWRGMGSLPSGIVDDDPASTASVIRHGDSYYLRRLYHDERALIDSLHSYLHYPLATSANTEKAQAAVRSFQDEGKVFDEQAEAILQACASPLTIICGGPGTGKTYTAGLLVNTLSRAIAPTEGRFTVALAAPTGKAAANLQKSIDAVLSAASADKNVECKRLAASTLHALLQIRSDGRRRRGAPTLLDVDLLVVDECSMIDTNLMSMLFSAMKPGARLVLLGDPYQLPPVGSGAFFADMLRFKHSLQGRCCAIELKTCVRIDLQAIVDFAAAIREGRGKDALEQLKGNDRGSGLCFRELSDDSFRDQRWVVEQGLKLWEDISFLESLPEGHSLHELGNSLMCQFNSFRILSPLRQGFLGVDLLNRNVLQSILKSRDKSSRFLVAPILLVHNDHQLSLFNGETGILIRSLKNGYDGSDIETGALQKGDIALFPDGSGAARVLPALLLPKFEYAYCLSVHKSQGSEFDSVLLIISQGAEIFGRQVLYTGATRARKLLTLLTSNTLILNTVTNEGKRLSGGW